MGVILTPLTRIHVKFIGENLIKVNEIDENSAEVVLRPGEIFLELIIKNISSFPLRITKIYGFTNLVFLQEGILIEDIQPREIYGMLKRRDDTEINFRGEGFFLQPNQEVYIKIRGVVKSIVLKNPVDLHLQTYCKPMGALREIIDQSELIGHIRVLTISRWSD